MFMSSKKVVTVAVLVTVLTWSTVMTVLGQVAAAAALLPSLGLLVQQIVQALTAPDGCHPAAGSPGPDDRPPAGPGRLSGGGQEPPR
ncbi:MULTISPECIES: hypothetical protein [unclassified Streptomyces]|uniref:hypothetical protein n=1 Tax=unclassified Streptomyces TaxID=2593676 RepID=UPI001F03F8C3|nr:MULTISPECIES: hypothetical protein [unclassified Streptomyces]MCH0564605.1 hypothetical protein [Streptomyces sp. MUM 2J]MCH0572038.1 hypothetical protein [Streptomyces sp. MUM 136J]